MKISSWILLLGLFVLLGCSKEEQAPLPPLKKIEVPEGVVGFYSGRLPCDNCKGNVVKAELKEDSSVVFIQNIVRGSTPDSVKTDTLSGRFTFDGDRLSMELSEGKVRYRFQQGSYGSLALLTGAGTVYKDQDGFKAELIRIYINPLRKTAGADTSKIADTALTKEADTPKVADTSSAQGEN
ncbi:MAG: copper resistance protein NlpE N-terminal domain-containing protein [Fibrobacter sp.]|nr:copper resistance protein NlpE N-terminal domain-containing protein [Fibrobacter sp.]MBR2468874.1 copper resistance protein NlpE N-terminal domain-containing protein [Fibrobacter sp.]